MVYVPSMSATFLAHERLEMTYIANVPRLNFSSNLLVNIIEAERNHLRNSFTTSGLSNSLGREGANRSAVI
jgi:hypothetical protein